MEKVQENKACVWEKVFACYIWRELKSAAATLFSPDRVLRALFILETELVLGLVGRLRGWCEFLLFRVGAMVFLGNACRG